MMQAWVLSIHACMSNEDKTIVLSRNIALE